MTPQGIKTLNIPFDVYADHEGTNSSELVLIDKTSLAHAKHKRDGGKEKESDSRDFGKCFHSLLLEDRQDFVIHPLVYPVEKTKKPKPWNWNSNWCKDWASKQEKEVMSHDDADSLVEMVKSVRSNEELSEVLPDSQTEVSIFAEKNGWKYKGRIDTLTAPGGPIIDFKSTTNARPDKFVRQAFDNGYFMQAAYYLDLCAMCDDRRHEFWFVAIEKMAPFACSIIKLKDGPISFIGMGRARYLTALSALKEAVKSGKWPAYRSIEAELAATPWMIKEIENLA